LAKTLVIAAIGLLGFARTSGATAITVAGTTTGCFGASCSTFTDIATSDPFGFDGTNFSALTTASGSATLDLGDFSRESDNFGTGDADVPFTLKVNFTLPTGIGSNPFNFSVTFEGTNPGGGGPVFVNFADNAFHTYSFTNGSGSGSFEFAIQDIGTGVPAGGGLDKEETLDIVGLIRGATFTPSEQLPGDPAAVPEPGSLILLGTGLASAGAAMRRRRSKRA
jgi:hypothetical protein